MRNARGHQCKVKMSDSEKKVNENTYVKWFPLSSYHGSCHHVDSGIS